MKMNLLYVVMLAVAVCQLEAQLLQKEHVAGNKKRLQLASIHNETESLEFEIFPAGQSAFGLVMPLSTFNFKNESENKKLDLIDISSQRPIIIKCSKGSFLPVYIQDGGPTSGQVQEDYDGPYYVSMWMEYPHVAQSAKTHVSYAIKKGSIGKIGLNIGLKGDYRLIAQEDVMFLDQK